MFLDVPDGEGFLQEGDEEEEFFVVSLVSYEGVDGDAVVQVEGEGEDGVVDYDYILLGPVQEYVQVLDEEVLHLDAVVPVKSLLKYLPVLVNHVQDLISVVLLARCEYHHLVH